MFDTNFFANPSVLLQGAIAGLLFGFLLQKSGVTRYNVILGQFLLKDFTVLKVMLSAIVVGALGIYAMRSTGLLGAEAMHIKPADLLGNALGGAIFGVGMAVFGYCPGTGVGAMADGSRHAIFGVLGMLVGAAVYAEAYPWVNAHVLTVGALGKVTIPSVIGISPWWIIAALAVAAAVGFTLLERFEQPKPSISMTREADRQVLPPAAC